MRFNEWRTTMTESQTITLRAKMIGAMLRNARRAAKKSLKQVAAMIGTTSSTLSSFEHGRKGISLPELELFAYHFDIPLSVFLTGTTPTSKKKPEFDPTTMVSLRQRMLGARLRKQRTEAELSMRALAGRTGLSAKRLSAYERGDRPIPVPELESLLKALDQSMDDYVDREGPVGEWSINKRAFERLLQLSPDLREFISNPDNQPYLQLAQKISDLSVDKLRELAEGLLDLTQ
jgi:transcriptional regulator with XRE-family HTH domain